MTTTLAVTGKSGSGKTTIAKAFVKVFKEYFPDKSILIFDNDLSGEMGHSFGFDIRNTIYGIRSGKHEYKTPVAEEMSKQEYIEWALEDIIVSVDDNVDLIVSWLVPSKDCRCPITGLMHDSIIKLIKRYDFVIFDCEFDLKYLSQIVDYPISTTLIVATASTESITLAKRIMEFSSKYALEGQIGVVLNRIQNGVSENVSALLKEIGLDILGVIPKIQSLKDDSVKRESKEVVEAVKEFYGRLNLPRGECQR